MHFITEIVSDKIHKLTFIYNLYGLVIEDVVIEPLISPQVLHIGHYPNNNSNTSTRGSEKELMCYVVNAYNLRLN